MKKKVVVANWKTNPATLREAKLIFLGTKRVVLRMKKIEIVICPPLVYLGELKKISINKISFGAQNCFEQEQGSQMGKISPSMLKTSRIRLVILGHSENRKEGEDNDLINQKIKLSLKNGLGVVVCIGEEQRDEEGLHFGFLKKQILDALNGVSKNYLKNILIAYEPIWAIGKEADGVITNKQLQEIVVFIKKVLVEKYSINDFKQVRILYGGSVDYKNVEELIMTDVDGFLVGRESLDKSKFEKLLKIVDGN